MYGFSRVIDVIKKRDMYSDLFYREIEKFRIVKYHVRDLAWYPLKKRWILPGWRGITGAERGSSGFYNYQLEHAANPWACFRQILDHIEWQYQWKSVYNWSGSDRVPTCPIVEEVCMETSLMQLELISDEELESVDFLDEVGFFCKNLDICMYGDALE